jgi:hypothetical protein
VKEFMPETLANIDFNGNKVLQLKQDKDTAWYKSYKDLASAFTNFIVEHREDVTEWKG